MLEDNQLVLLNFDLRIDGLWENKLVNKFPNASFVIQDSYPTGDDSFFGLLRIESKNIGEIKKFFKNNFSNVFLDSFCEDQNLFYYWEKEFFLYDILSKINGILIWPIELNDSSKKIKVLLKRKYVEEFIDAIEKKEIEVMSFSVMNVDFNIRSILTDKQKDILMACFKFGYYEFPKRISLNGLAEEVNLAPSTVCIHLQKIESRFFNSPLQDLFFRRMLV